MKNLRKIVAAILALAFLANMYHFPVSASELLDIQETSQAGIVIDFAALQIEEGQEVRIDSDCGSYFILSMEAESIFEPFLAPQTFNVWLAPFWTSVTTYNSFLTGSPNWHVSNDFRNPGNVHLLFGHPAFNPGTGMVFAQILNVPPGARVQSGNLPDRNIRLSAIDANSPGSLRLFSIRATTWVGGL